MPAVSLKYLKYCFGLLFSCGLALPAMAQGIEERACEVIQSRDYDSWLETLSVYEERLREAHGSVSDDESQELSRYIEDNWQRHLFEPGATTTSEPGELRYARRRACSDEMSRIVQGRVNAQPSTLDDDLLDRVEAVVGSEWRELGEMRMMFSLLVRFGPVCGDFRTLAIARRAGDASRELHSPPCPVE